MLNSILNLKGVNVIDKKSQQLIKGGTRYTYCLATCAGHCTLGGVCYEFIK